MKKNFNPIGNHPGKDIKRLLNLNYLKYTNRTHSVGEDDLPELICTTKVIPDYLVLYSEPSKYNLTNKTCLCFYNYDSCFDGFNGLFNAIYYNIPELIEYYKERFKNVKFVITPDNSELGDIHGIENKHRLFRSRIIGLWFAFEIKAVVIPNITFPHINEIEYCLKGLEKCTVVAFSTKGHMSSKAEQDRLRKAVIVTVDYLNLETIIVFDVCKDNIATLEIFDYAIKKGINVVIPDNTLKLRNMNRKEAKK